MTSFLQVVTSCREKQDRERIEPLRLAERAALTLACKEVNLGQMRDKHEQAEARREEQRLQNALQLKTLQAQVRVVQVHRVHDLEAVLGEAHVVVAKTRLLVPG